MVDIVSRAGWDARPPKNKEHVNRHLRTEFIVHYSGGPATQTVRAIQDWCMDGRGFSDIDYNMLVRGTTGQAYMGRGWDVRGAHTVGHNTSGVAVCIISNGPISDAAKRTTIALYEQACELFGRRLKMTVHRRLDETDCPGDTITKWVMAGMPAPDKESESDVAFSDDKIPVTATTGKELFDPDKPAETPVPAATILQLSAIWAKRSAETGADIETRLTRLEADIAAIKAAVIPNGG